MPHRNMSGDASPCLLLFAQDVPDRIVVLRDWWGWFDFSLVGWPDQEGTKLFSQQPTG